MPKSSICRLSAWAGLCLTLLASAAHATLIVGYDFSHSLNSGDMTLNSTPFYIFDGTASNIAANGTTIFHAPEAQDLSANNRDLWYERRNTGYTNTNSNLQPRYSISKTTSNGSGMTGIVTYGGAFQTSVAGDNTTATFANSELTAAGFTVDATFEVDKSVAASSTLPLISINRFTIGLLGTADPDSGKLAATVTGTMGTSSLGKRVTSLGSILKTGSTRPTFDLRVIWEVNGPGTADDRLLMFLNGAHQDTQKATLDLVAVGNNQVLKVLATGNGAGVLSGVLLHSLSVYSGTPPTIAGLPEPGLAMTALAAGMLVLSRRTRPSQPKE